MLLELACGAPKQVRQESTLASLQLREADHISAKNGPSPDLADAHQRNLAPPFQLIQLITPVWPAYKPMGLLQTSRATLQHSAAG